MGNRWDWFIDVEQAFSSALYDFIGKGDELLSEEPEEFGSEAARIVVETRRAELAKEKDKSG